MDAGGGAVQYRRPALGAALGGGPLARRFQASIAGGIAIGSWGWGRLTDAAGVETAFWFRAG